MNAKDILKKYQKAITERDGFLSMYTDAYTYTAPSRDSFNFQSQGARNDIVVYNSEPINLVKRAACNIASLMCPAGLKFFNLTSSKKINDADQETINQQLAKSSDVLFEYLNKSNYYVAFTESCIDLMIGTGGVMTKYSGNIDNPLAFKSVKISKIAFTEDSNGIVNYVFQECEMSSDDAQIRYPMAKFPPNQECLNFLVCVVIDEDKNTFEHVIMDKSGEDVYYQETVDSNPFAIFRWNVLAGESWGRGVVCDMLGTIKTANLMMADILTSAERVINPPTTVMENSVVNPAQLDFSPGSIIAIKPQVGISNPISQMQYSANLPFGMQTVDQFNKQLANALLVDVLGSVGDSQQTATEVSARMQMAAHVLGAVYGRLQREVLSPIINNSIKILTKLGLIPKLPAGIKIEYSSPITYMQKNQEFQRFMQSIQAIAQTSGQNAQQAIFSSIDVAQLPTWIAEHLGADLSLFRTTAQLKDIMSKQLQASLQQQQLQANQALAGAPINTQEPGVTRL